MARATIIGSGPNGLAAGVTLARAGYAVRVLEAADTVGGGLRTAESTLPGFRHDVCSTVHPTALASPFFHAFGLERRLDWIRPEASYAHPLDGGRAAIAWRDLDRTATALGADGDAWRTRIRPLTAHIDGVVDFTGNQLLRVPRDPLTALRYAIRMLEQGTPLAASAFRTEEAAALLAGAVAHGNAPLPSLAGAAAGLLLAALGHAGGWPYPRGGAQGIADALVADITAHGGSVETGVRVTDLETLDWGDPRRGDLLILNTSPRLALTHRDVPPRYARAIGAYRYGPGAAKVDFALDGPVPWTHPEVGQAATVHLGGTRAEVWASENAVAAGRMSERPYVLTVQPSVLDDSRAPAGKAVFWAYIHVPPGSDLDPTELITAQVERFAPGFRDLILAHHAVPASSREAINPAEIGGDISGGVFDMRQALRRPILSPTPWRTPMPGVYLASASTPPGPSVNGMAGWHAARTALQDAGSPATLSDLFD
ncbi:MULTISPECIES: phytoene desaturase family protein [Microbacterium]|uniref:Pyridine nucleotide-disulfide oxidoreductase domain-containing protein 2 n=1 Tax=Microbacterium aurugineum TaxID=2851642 RepID=A0ABY4J0J4_9MICO|nr:MULTISPECIES: NAD(P)/FAD-dependent oxidoreductase [Microbacterium]QEA28791.1 NAD(P)/FAD-dependent oxidoreductase [Microbacterium sp. CBA3102]UPL18464.1 NAD(P)/FAD-dependent oxidoreductase [Microbacterium aurugineum]